MLEFRKLPFKKQNVYVMGCSHYSHKNIAGAAVSEWNDGYRTFSSVEEMNTTLVNNINALVKEDDCLLELGDFSFGGKEQIWEFRKQIVCKNIYHVYGNHDQYIRTSTLLFIPEEDVPIARKLGITLHKNEKNEWYTFTSYLFTECADAFYLKIEGRKLYLNHYPLLTWFQAKHGVYMLHSHDHGNINHLNEKVKRLDVGIDSYYQMFGKYQPFSFLEIESIMEAKSNLSIGHH